MKFILSTTTLCIFALAGSAAQNQDPGVYGPGLDQVRAVRSLTIKISGGLNETISGKMDDRHTTLSGECKPNMFANLSFDTGETMGDHGGIGFATREPIKMGQTGPIDLAWVLIDMVKIKNLETKRFKSSGGTLTLTTHTPAKGSRRMTGTIAAKNLQPLDGLKSPPVNVEASFDMDFSCGVR